MAEFYNISEWNEKPWFQTGGTRSKVIVENPETGELYYFKTSLLKENKDYKHEFWSEIIASEVGSFLGFDMLRYDIAYNNGEIGCLSKSMNTEGLSTLTEGISYLTGFNTEYNPKEKTSKQEYTFNFIKECLQAFNLERYIDNIIEIIVLDSIISNGDRHQENWGVLTKYNEIIDVFKDWAKKKNKHLGGRILLFFLALITNTKQDELKDLVEKLDLFMPSGFSPIYDSGSCLGREISDDKIERMLSDSTMLEAYIRRGQSEIHWEGKKMNHFELIDKVKNEYGDSVRKCISRVKEQNHLESVKSIVLNIDKNLPLDQAAYKLPLKRKEFIIKLLHLRSQKLINTIE